MRNLLAIPGFVLFILFGCNQSNKPASATSAVGRGKLHETAHSTTIQPEEPECVRGAAEPLIDSTVFPNTKFWLLKDSITGYEAVKLGNGDSLTIKNWGCEYYCLTFSFETTRLKDKISDTKTWYNHAASLMEEVSKGLKSAIDIEKGVAALKQYSDTSENPKFKRDIDYGGTLDYREIISIEKVSRTKNKTTVVITYCNGPL